MKQASKQRIAKLQKIFKEEYGKRISFSEASEAARNLVGFFDLLAKIDARDKRDKVLIKRNQKN